MSALGLPSCQFDAVLARPRWAACGTQNGAFPKTSTSRSPEAVNIPFMVKGTWRMWLRWWLKKDYPGSFGWAHRVLRRCKRRPRSEPSPAEPGPGCVAGEGRGAQGPRSLERQRNGLSPGPLEGAQPHWHLDLNPMRLILDFHLRNCKMINLCIYKALHLWECIREAVRKESIHTWPSWWKFCFWSPI